MFLKRDFNRKLLHLRNVIDMVLTRDEHCAAEYYGSLFPALFQVFSYIWSNSDLDSVILNKNSSKCVRLPDMLRNHPYK